MKKLVILVLSLVCASQSVVATELIYSAQDLALMQLVADLVQEGCAPEDVVTVLEERVKPKKRSYLAARELQFVIGLSIGAFTTILGYIGRWVLAYKRNGGCNRDCFIEGLKCHCSQRCFNHAADCFGCHHSLRFDVESQNQAAAGATDEVERHDLMPPAVPVRMHISDKNTEDQV
ncbi:hypothetical protein IPF37_00810 [bacterium]|nr:MAG: hypothetical protein IPF37_00810 [bacterium]